MIRTLASGIALAIGCSTIAHALPANEIETFYYTDKSYQKEAGYTFLSCQGATFRDGSITRYRVRRRTPCHSGGPTGVACFVDGFQTSCPAGICDSSLFTCE
jgi:hypothetical protein